MGVIPEERENWKDRQRGGGGICKWRDKESQRGKEDKKESKWRESGCFKKHLGVIREREKNAGLS